MMYSNYSFAMRQLINELSSVGRHESVLMASETTTEVRPTSSGRLHKARRIASEGVHNESAGHMKPI